MSVRAHPNAVLFSGEKRMQNIASCEHFAGSEKLINKALDLQDKLGPIFDITCDCEDGARVGAEAAHARMVADIIASERNRFKQMGVRIHDPSHPAWRQDVDLIVGHAAHSLAYVTIPKTGSAAQVAEVSGYIQQVARAKGFTGAIPIHVIVETHGALEDVTAIAKLPHMQVLDFGLMDFVSGHHGAIPASAMRSPGQFQHQLLIRAKSNVVAAALAHGVVPAHNVCVTLTDEAVIGNDAWRAHNEFGFQRMWSIHPAQILPIVNAMGPSFAEVEDAAAILTLAQDAEWGPVSYKNELHDRATYRYYWSILEKAKTSRMAIPENAEARFFSA